VHYCNPGAVTYWNELLLTMMESRPIHNALNARLPQPPAPPAYPGLPPVPPGVQVRGPTVHSARVPSQLNGWVHHALLGLIDHTSAALAWRRVSLRT
jgi:hypothetical protein